MYSVNHYEQMFKQSENENTLEQGNVILDEESNGNGLEYIYK